MTSSTDREWNWPDDEDWTDAQIERDPTKSPDEREAARQRLGMRKILRDQLRHSKGVR